MRTPISLITGYLGSGKTTLLRRILQEADRRIAVIMNEFGEIAVDGRLIRGKNVNMVELGGGCVCCSLIGEFEAAVREIIKKVKPDAILVETTGVAEPDALVTDIEETLPEVRLDSVITVVDADGMVRFPSLGHTGRVQIEMGDFILVNKTDLVNEQQLKGVEGRVRELNDRAALFRTHRCDVDTALLFGVYAERVVAGRREGHVEEVEHFSLNTEKPLDAQRFDEFLTSLSSEFYRVKGFVRLADGGRAFNYVAGRWGFEEFEVDRTELVFIGRDIARLREGVAKRLEECHA